MTDNYTNLDLTGVIIQVQMQKADETFIIQTEKITVNNNIINVEIDKDLTREFGKGKLQIVLVKNGKTFGSWVIKCNIKAGAINDNDGQSENKVTITEALTNKITEANNTKVELDKSIANGDTEKMREDIDKNIIDIKNNSSDLVHIEQLVDSTVEYKGLNKIQEIIQNAYLGTPSYYFMVGDSTREINGAYIFNNISKILSGYNIKSTLQAKAGLKSEHWSETTLNLQTGYPTVSQLIALIPTDGTNCIVDICLGINDTSTSNATQIAQYIQTGIDKIKASKPNVTINLTSPNRYFYEPSIPKLQEAYRTLSSNIEYGFINVLDNVFKEWSNEVQAIYFVDNTHPNKLGQDKMAMYIIDKLMPDFLKYQDGIPNFKGEIDRNFVSDQNLSGSGFSIELKYLGSKPSNNLFIKKLDGKWYIYNSNTGTSISTEVLIKNGVQKVNKSSWANVDFECYIEILDYTVFDKITVPNSYFQPILNGVVDVFTPYYSQKKLLQDRRKMSNDIEDLNNEKIDIATINDLFATLKGSIDNTDTNYNSLKLANVRIEFRQDNGTAITNLTLAKNSSGNYYIHDNTNSVALTDYIQPIAGSQRLRKPSWGTVNFDGYITIDNPQPLIDFTLTGVYVKLKNAKVTKLSKDRTLKENMSYILDNI